MATAGDLINGALRLIGQLAEGESPSSETSADALFALNQMLDAWSIDDLIVYTFSAQTFTWPAATSSRTIGPSGADFTGSRPIRLNDATYFKDTAADIAIPVQIINREEYNSIGSKSASSTYPQFISMLPDSPTATLVVWPVPAGSLQLRLHSMAELSQPAVLATDLEFPPGYLRAFRFNLACELAPEFGKEPPTWVAKIAMNSKADIERINAPMHRLSVPPALTAGSRSYDINTDQ